MKKQSLTNIAISSILFGIIIISLPLSASASASCKPGDGNPDNQNMPYLIDIHIKLKKGWVYSDSNVITHADDDTSGLHSYGTPIGNGIQELMVCKGDTIYATGSVGNLLGDPSGSEYIKAPAMGTKLTGTYHYDANIWGQHEQEFISFTTDN